MEAIDGADVREDTVDNISREGTAVPSFFQQPGTEHLWGRAGVLSPAGPGAWLGRDSLQVRAVFVDNPVEFWDQHCD